MLRLRYFQGDVEVKVLVGTEHVTVVAEIFRFFDNDIRGNLDTIGF